MEYIILVVIIAGFGFLYKQKPNTDIDEKNFKIIDLEKNIIFKDLSINELEKKVVFRGHEINEGYLVTEFLNLLSLRTPSRNTSMKL